MKQICNGLQIWCGGIAFPAFNDGGFLSFGANPRAAVQKLPKVKCVNNDGGFLRHFPRWDLRRRGAGVISRAWVKT